MILQPQRIEDLKQALVAAAANGLKITSVRLDALNRLVEHRPEDMTATAEAGMSLRAFQDHLASRGQWLPVDPPMPDSLTLSELLSTDASGPRRCGCGTVRDYLLGMKVVLADGRLIKSGGKVVKNVAGYDLCKLFIGSHGTLGVIVEATFKLKPIPESEQFVQIEFNSLEPADAFLQSVFDSDLTPTVLDLHNLAGLRTARRDNFAIVLGFAGPREDVAYQLATAQSLGAQMPSNLDHDREFWNGDSFGPARRIAVLPSEVPARVRQLGRVPFVARAGHGVIWYRGHAERPKADVPIELMQRVKAAFDPKHVLPDLPL